jgi:hypothetical protein
MFKFGLQKRSPRPRSYDKHRQKHQCTLGVIQGRPFHVITLEQKESDDIIQIITISKFLSRINTLFRVIWDLTNLGQFDHINQMIIIIKRLPLY